MLRPPVLPLLATVVALSACGDASAPPPRPAAAPAPAPAPTPHHASTIDHGRPVGYALAVRDGLQLYSVKTRGGRYRLVRRRGSGPARPAGVATNRDPFLVDLGTDAAGRTLAVYQRCVPGPCRLLTYDPATGREAVAATAPPGRISAVALDRGTITYAMVEGHRSKILSVPLGGGPTRTVLAARGEITALDTSRHGLAYVRVTPYLGAGGSDNHLVLRRPDGSERRVATTGYGMENGADIAAVGFTGHDLVWGVTGSHGTDNYGAVQRLDLRTRHRTAIRTMPPGGLIAVAADSARPDGTVLLAYQAETDNDGFAPDADDETLHRYGPRSFR
jgi:hypothetical protein